MKKWNFVFNDLIPEEERVTCTCRLQWHWYKKLLLFSSVCADCGWEKSGYFVYFGIGKPGSLWIISGRVQILKFYLLKPCWMLACLLCVLKSENFLDPSKFLDSFPEITGWAEFSLVVDFELYLYLYHQYSKAKVTQANPIPTNITMNTPPGKGTKNEMKVMRGSRQEYECARI